VSHPKGAVQARAIVFNREKTMALPHEALSRRHFRPVAIADNNEKQ
jgi:hypothetical protein